ncbi:MAG: Isoflavone reductase [uncultured bacterium]|nr:MAG: Isoflavone reductase [uncultured bacterium]
MQILILGGTVFLGRHLVDAALNAGHQVTTFRRGRERADLPEGVATIIGDRRGDHAELRYGQWDAVVDCSGYFPAHVASAAKALSSHVGQYIFISSVLQYADLSKPGIREDDPSAQGNFIFPPPLNELTYGPLKAMCEQEVLQVFPGRATILRPGYLVGPRDRSERFPTWVRRASMGGVMLVPGSGNRAWQFIDVRDLAAWIISIIERRTTGIFNVTGPSCRECAGSLMDRIVSAAGGSPIIRHIDTDCLRRVGGERWLHLADWADPPESICGVYEISIERAKCSGLVFRPLEQTVLETLDSLAHVPSSWPGSQSAIADYLIQEEAVLSACD